MDTFNDANLTPDQIKMLTLQFMGQHLTGELKELDKNLVNKTNTLQGMALDPTAVINSIPSAPQPQIQPPPGPQLSANFVNTPPVPATATTTVTQNIPPVVTPAQQPTDQNQLEFSFETSPLSERIFESLERIEKRLSYIEEKLAAKKDTKKKD
jgi:hypothetical protein